MGHFIKLRQNLHKQRVCWFVIKSWSMISDIQIFTWYSIKKMQFCAEKWNLALVILHVTTPFFNFPQFRSSIDLHDQKSPNRFFVFFPSSPILFIWIKLCCSYVYSECMNTRTSIYAHNIYFPCIFNKYLLLHNSNLMVNNVYILHFYYATWCKPGGKSNEYIWYSSIYGMYYAQYILFVTNACIFVFFCCTPTRDLPT